MVVIFTDLYLIIQNVSILRKLIRVAISNNKSIYAFRIMFKARASKLVRISISLFTFKSDEGPVGNIQRLINIALMALFS